MAGEANGVGGKQPATGGKQPARGGVQPSWGGKQPVAAGKRPAMGGKGAASLDEDDDASVAEESEIGESEMDASENASEADASEVDVSDAGDGDEQVRATPRKIGGGRVGRGAPRLDPSRSGGLGPVAVAHLVAPLAAYTCPGGLVPGVMGWLVHRGSASVRGAVPCTAA